MNNTTAKLFLMSICTFSNKLISNTGMLIAQCDKSQVLHSTALQLYIYTETFTLLLYMHVTAVHMHVSGK